MGIMQIHASCGARDGQAVVLLGPPGCGKSDMLLRLIDRGFRLVADDRVDVQDLWARAPRSLEGLIEVRGLGILRLDPVTEARIVLAVELAPCADTAADRLPEPRRHAGLDVPLIQVDPRQCSAAQRIDLAFECALGRTALLVGAFA